MSSQPGSDDPTPLFTGADHLCIVTEDLDRAVRVWADRYGIGPWRVYRYDGRNMSVGGRPADFAMRVALSALGPSFRIEIIQPLDDRSPYADSLAAHHGADHLHHVRLAVLGFDEASQRLEGIGAPVIFDARFPPADGDGPPVRGRYIDTRADLGFLLEVADIPAGFARPDAEDVYPADTA